MNRITKYCWYFFEDEKFNRAMDRCFEKLKNETKTEKEEAVHMAGDNSREIICMHDVTGRQGWY